MGVQSEYLTSVAIDGATATRVNIPAPPRGYISRIFVVETSSVGGIFTVDVYNKSIDLDDTEAERSPYRICERLSSQVDSDFGGLNGVGTFDRQFPYVAGPSHSAVKNVGRTISMVITPPGAGARIFSITVTFTGTTLA